MTSVQEIQARFSETLDELHDMGLAPELGIELDVESGNETCRVKVQPCSGHSTVVSEFKRDDFEHAFQSLVERFDMGEL